MRNNYFNLFLVLIFHDIETQSQYHEESSPFWSCDMGAEPLKNKRHEAFAGHYAANGNASAAWVATGGKGGNADVQGSKWVKKSGIPDRVKFLRALAAENLRKKDGKKVDRQNQKACLAVEEKRKILAGIARGEITNRGSDGSFVKASDMIAAIKADNDLSGQGAEAEANKAIAITIRKSWE